MGFQQADIEPMYVAMCDDIVRERARLGGDWAIATVLDSRSIRDFVRARLGPELEIVVLEMTLEEQMARIRGRHDGSEDAVDMMKAFYDFCKPAEAGEPNTLRIRVTPDMTPQDVIKRILAGPQDQ